MGGGCTELRYIYTFSWHITYNPRDISVRDKTGLRAEYSRQGKEILVFSAASRRLHGSSSGCTGLISLAEPSLTGASYNASF